MSEGSERIRQRAIGERLARVRERIAAAAQRSGRDPDGVEIVAVTKGFPVSTVTEAVNAGLTLIGENRAQELLAKATEVQPREWHFVGRIQRNKVRSLAPLVAVWHSVDRIEVAEAIADEAQGARVHVQVNVAGEAQKGGCRPTEAAGLVARCHALGLRVVGLMTVPPIEGDPQPHFAALARLAADAGIAGLSMGMSGDFEVAVEEGSTVVRLGSILFGPRPR